MLLEVHWIYIPKEHADQKIYLLRLCKEMHIESSKIKTHLVHWHMYTAHLYRNSHNNMLE